MVAEFDRAAFDLAVGQLTTEPVRTAFGYHVIEALGRREGDVPEADARRELAEGLLRHERGSDRARVGARWVLDQMRSGADVRAALAARGDDLPRLHWSARFSRSQPAFDGDDGTVRDAAFGRPMSAPVAPAPLQLGERWIALRLLERGRPSELGPLAPEPEAPPRVAAPPTEPPAASAEPERTRAREPTSREPSGSASSPAEDARACTMRGDSMCVIRTLEARARTEQEHSMLIEAYRATGRTDAALSHMRTFVSRFPTSRRAENYRQILARE
jgi:hypothetical protein